MKNLLFLLALLGLSGCAPQPPTPSLAPYQEVKEPEPQYESEVYIEQKVNPLPLVENIFETSKVAMQSIRRNAIVKNALSYLGKRDGKDCSGFVTLVNHTSGHPYFLAKELSESFDNARKSRAMFNLMCKKSDTFDEKRLPKLADLVFFENTERRVSKSKNKVIENITHVGIVTRVDEDGTVEFIHHSNGKNIVDYMNFNYPKLTTKDGKKINTYMKRCKSNKGAVRTDCLNIAFFVAYGTFQ